LLCVICIDGSLLVTRRGSLGVSHGRSTPHHSEEKQCGIGMSS